MKQHLLPLLLLWIALFPSLAQAQDPVAVTKTNAKPIYMHIMPWFDGPGTMGEGNWGYHWKMQKMNPNIIVDNATGKRQIASHYYPQIGPYDSSDPDVIAYQLLLMKLSGVDGILIDWYGTAGNVGDIASNLRNSDAIVNGTGPSGLKFALVIEDRFTGGNANIQHNSMVYARDNYFSKPNYFKYNNNPFVGIFGPSAIENEAGWNTALAGIGDIEFLPLEYQGNEVGSHLDGEYAWPYQTRGTTDHYAQVENFYKLRAPNLKTSMGVVYPGFNDFYAQGENGGTSYFNIPYNGTGTLVQMMDLANQYSKDIDILQLATWNDYGEGTIFEPTVEFGYSFLVKLQQFTGVSYTENDLKQVTRFYNLRKKYKGNAAINTKLDQVYKYFAALQISNAVALMCTIESDGNCPTAAAPVISSSLTATGTVGAAFNYTITASNNPSSYEAIGLPQGLSLNASTGLISGTASAAFNGNVTIKASNSNGADTKTLALTIQTVQCASVSSVSLNTSLMNLAIAQTSTLTATVLPANACNKTLSWSSNNTGVATVNANGLVTAVSAGNAIISVKTNDGNKTATVGIVVSPATNGPSYYRIKNRWQSNYYLYDNGNQAGYGTGNDQSYQWILEEVADGLREFKNRATGEYLHVEHLMNYTEVATRSSGWMSSRWAIEPATDGYVRIRNAWQSTHYLHIQNLAGYTEHGIIESSWMSGQWMLEAVPNVITDNQNSVNADNTMYAYPNPTDGILNVTTKWNSDNGQMRIIDALGYEVYKGMATNSLDVSGLVPGVYTLLFSSDTKTQILRFVKK